MAGWQVLAPADSGRPVLLIKYEVETTGYVVYVTDLVHVWQETMTRRSILSRALDMERISVDPTAGDDQFKLFLDKIKCALDGEQGTLRKLLPNRERDDFILELRVKLPGGLEPLEWNVSLAQKPGDVLFQQLFLPAFEQSLHAQTQVQSLLTHLGEKDHVISRLVDKLESSGTDLTNVFPGAHALRGSKATIRGILFRSVPGLSSFEELQWRQNMDQRTFATSTDLFKHVFANLEDSELAKSWKSPDHWWTRLDATGQELKPIKPFSEPAKPALQQERSRTTEDDDAFQVQDLSRLRKHRNSSPAVQVKDSQAVSNGPSPDEMSTDDGDSDDGDSDKHGDTDLAQQSFSSVSPAKKDPGLAPRKIGILGKKKSGSTPPSSLVPETVPGRPPQAATETKSASPVPKLRKKLGKIGRGRHDASDTEMRELPVRSSQEAASRVADQEQHAERPIDLVPQAQETEEEKAERRRAELKRELDEQRKGPARKKRKF